MHHIVKFLKSLLREKKGEIATILTVATLGLMVLGAFAGSKLAEKSTEQRTQARGFGELKTQGLSGCQIVDTDQGPGCWCSTGGWQGHCFEGKKRGEPPSQLCKDNCSNKNGGTPNQNITPAPTGAGDQTGSPTGANCNLKSSFLSPAVNDKCGNCVVFKSGDLEANGLRKAFDNWGFSACNNNQIASYWCNGGVSEEGKNTCQARLAECKATAADCTGAPGADKYPLPGEKAAPTAPPGGAPDGGGRPRATATPDPAGTYGNYVVIDPETIIRAENKLETPIKYSLQVIRFYQTNPYVTFNGEDDDNITENGTALSLLKLVGTDPSSGYTYQPSPDKLIIREIQQQVKTESIIPDGVIVIGKFDRNTSTNTDARHYYNKSFKLCNPYKGRSFLEETLVPTISVQEIYKNCKDRLNKYELDFDNADPTPVPTLPSGTYNDGYYVFQIKLIDKRSNHADNNTFKLLPNEDISGIPNTISLISNTESNFDGPTSIPEESEYLSDVIIYKINPSVVAGYSNTLNPNINSVMEKEVAATDFSSYNITDKTSGSSNVNIVPCFPIRLTPTPAPTIDPANISSYCPPVIQTIEISDIGLITSTPIPTSIPYTPGAPTPALTGTRKIIFDVKIEIGYNPTNGKKSDAYLALSITNDLAENVIPVENIYSDKWNDSRGWWNDYYWYQWPTKTLTGYDIGRLDSLDANASIFTINADVKHTTWCQDKTHLQQESITKTDLLSDTSKEETKFVVTIRIPCSGSSKDTVVEVQGSSNEAFRLAMEKWVKGELNVLQMSAFISQLTRTPGLQITTCDPRKGECNIL